MGNGEYRRARNAAEEAAGEVLAQLELKRLGPGMSFEEERGHGESFKISEDA